jgi:mono/diheme cytochrome c family protein
MPPNRSVSILMLEAAASMSRRLENIHKASGASNVKRFIGRIALGLIGIFLLAATALGATALTRWDRTYDVPLPDLHASSDPEVIDRGRYLVFGPAHCSYCHTPQESWAALDAGEEIPLIGGYSFQLPIGSIHSSNLTPDVETGIGRHTDGEIARMLRHGVRPDGRASLPLMEFQNMSDEDVVAVISYLRSAPPVRNEVPENEWNLLGKTLLATMIGPVHPDGIPPVASPAHAATVERGGYIANSVANCAGCHSPRNLADGSYTGPRFSGGVMDVDGDPEHFFSVPNLTPDPETGHITGWSEDQFLARFRAGKVHSSSHMPWDAFARMSDDDIRAVYRYLRTLEPVSNPTGALLQRKR